MVNARLKGRNNEEAKMTRVEVMSYCWSGDEEGNSWELKTTGAHWDLK
jgi:hypothetical protein